MYTYFLLFITKPKQIFTHSLFMNSRYVYNVVHPNVQLVQSDEVNKAFKSKCAPENLLNTKHWSSRSNLIF